MPDFMPVCKQNFLLSCKPEMRTVKKVIEFQLKTYGTMRMKLSNVFKFLALCRFYC